MMGRPPSCLCGSCHKCKHRAYMREWYRTRPGYAAEFARRKRARICEYEKERYHNDAEFRQRKAARNTVNQAIRRGYIQRGPCEECGAPEAQAHHDDYDRPMDVRWLCDLHHRALHGEQSAIEAIERREAA